MFLGSYKPSFDPISRRVALPKKIRDYLAKNTIILSLGFEECIFGFDINSWEKESNKQIDQPLIERSARDLRRFFFSSAEAVNLDDQGRFVIPQNLLNFAKIAKPVIIGAGDHFEIWDQDIWEEERTRLSTQ